MSIAFIKAVKLRDRGALNRLAWIASLGLAAAAYVPLLARYASELWSTAGYRLAPVFLILAVLSVRQRVRALEHVEPGQRAPKLAFGLAAAMLGLAVMADSPEMAAASLLALGMAAALRWGGLPAARAVVGPWLLACLVLRLPADSDVLWMQSVARLTLAVAHRALDALGVLHDVEGLSVVLPGARLWMDAAHYGLFSPWSGVALVLAVCVWARRWWLDSLLMLIAGCGWFVLVDVLRIVATVVISGLLKTHWTGGIAAAGIDYVALVMMLLLVLSTDHVGLLFGKAMRLARPARRTRSMKKAPLPVTTVTVTGVTLDANGQLVKVVNQYALENSTQSPWPPETAVAAQGPGLRPDWPALAIVYGLLCLAQAIGLRGASGASGDWKAAAETALHVPMPAEFGGWRLESPVVAQAKSTLPETIDEESPGPMASWLYRQNHLTFKLTVRPRGRAWQDSIETWRDRGWQLDPPNKPLDETPSAAPAIACREVQLSKFYQPGYACIWESRWDAGRRFLSPAPGGWLAAAAAVGDRARQICTQAQNVGQAHAAGAPAAAGGWDVAGVLVSYRVLSQDELAAGRQLFDRLAAKLQRSVTPDQRPRP